MVVLILLLEHFLRLVRVHDTIGCSGGYASLLGLTTDFTVVVAPIKLDRNCLAGRLVSIVPDI
jgi:hypothetical protein